MKTQLSLATLVTFFLSVSWITPGSYQQTVSTAAVKEAKALPPDFSFFRTHRQGRGVTATWGLNSNGSVTGFVLQRTYEDPSDPYAAWDDICAMPCGNGRSFKHED